MHAATPTLAISLRRDELLDSSGLVRLSGHGHSSSDSAYNAAVFINEAPTFLSVVAG
tara:strand:- start:15 stop:185 length:171 start_codon:yes stop_codon:yes gene_type:complete